MEKFRYVSELELSVQDEIKVILVKILSDEIPVNELNDVIENAMDSKISDLEENLTKEQIKSLLTKGVLFNHTQDFRKFGI